MPRRFLLFQLYGPLASWGSIAVGDQRPSFDRPSKSAVVGLLAAALGLHRPDWRLAPEEAAPLDRQHRALADWFYLALRVEAQGVYFKDYHTVQVPRGGPYPSRTSELQRVRPGEGGKQTYREYYAGMRSIVCLWERAPDSEAPTVAEERLSLERLRDRLLQPGFLLYLGRKSCPPSLPLGPHINATAANARDALEAAAQRYRDHLEEVLWHEGQKEREQASKLITDKRHRVFWDSPGDEGFGTSYTEVQRWDEIGSRHRWQFQPRREKTVTS